MNVAETGRKFWALQACIVLLALMIILVYTLAFFDHSIPAVYTVIGSTLASAPVVYLGVNAYQKKLDADKKGDA